ncbi:MAG: threonylcarbamoyl-AMP synthase [Deltaproteobacteria bacterium]|nr:threonylcarbamoyl-AMP synthase [Deltaproteobacteria bacterium]
MDLFQAIAAIKRGEVIVFPTETLYGLGADALNDTAVEKVFQLKGRDPHNPIPILIADQVMLHRLVAEISPAAQMLMQTFWPGALTIVLPAQADLPKPLLNSTGGIGVRVSSQPIANQLVKDLRRPLTATSANPSGQPAASTLQQAKSYFTEGIEIFIDGGKLPSKIGSTVVEIIEDKIKIIREGEISALKLRHAMSRRTLRH